MGRGSYDVIVHYDKHVGPSQPPSQWEVTSEDLNLVVCTVLYARNRVTEMLKALHSCYSKFNKTDAALCNQLYIWYMVF